jgi:hypothetical protein
MDHFWDARISSEDSFQGNAVERGDFLDGAFSWKKARRKDRLILQMSREGWIHLEKGSCPVFLEKKISFYSGRNRIEAAYTLENRWENRLEVTFCPESNLAFFATHDDTAYYLGEKENKIGGLLGTYSRKDCKEIGIVDHSAQVSVSLAVEPRARFSLSPIQTVSHSEREIELTFQGVTVSPLWQVSLKPGAVWRGALFFTIG